ncbi:ImmA/IrrE family metallo-endopeptidase [Vibrio aestuarianus]|uniref:ImmA/IrrE family metallo-endopeptidase n=1 Tax=Vibrio aestuarianus TaxID=28171 RepID=UPI00237CA052|nr:ImmA/IrrE family metallo-endopeptidase [Vibrio aestuarianus]MDE1265817.1 ImmA/IrrE family metallo-endopeptidase [Vibrio aestuarianus]MDE1297925.1 ImmA/IrrE family metallo-endopeptidase [Vibrio aestuarianus]
MEQFKLPSKTTIYKKVRECGPSKAILKRVLPDWWNDDLLQTNAGLLQFSLLLRNRLGIQMELDQSGMVNFSMLPVLLQYKKRSTTDISKLSDSSLLIQAIGKTFIRALLYNEVNQKLEELFGSLSRMQSVDLDTVVALLWENNVPVLYLDNFPQSFSRPAGTIVRDGDLYAIILSHKHKSPSTQLFVLLHEIGHMKFGHLNGSGILSDASVSALGESLKEDTDQQEIEADNFALNVLRSGVDIQGVIGGLGAIQRPAELALHAQKMSKEVNVNPGHFVLTYGRETRNWPLAHQALKFLEQGDARSIFKKHYLDAKKKYEFKLDDIELLERMI